MFCDWDVPYPVQGDGEKDCVECSAFEELSATQQERVMQVATELLWNWTDRRYGVCDVTVMPCRVECMHRATTFYGGGWRPYRGYGFGCGTCSSSCSCAPDSLTSIELPGAVASVSEVIISGVILDPSDYVLRDGVLYRTDGGVFPVCNHPDADPTVPGSDAWAITFQQGIPVPAGGIYAAQKLACEFAKAICGDNDCELPRRVQSITRQGVSVGILDSFDDLDDRRTGIWEVDSWIASVNTSVGTRLAVFSPDIAPQRGTFRGQVRGRR